MAVTIDCGEAFDLHPPNKEPVGRRLGLIARALRMARNCLLGPLFRVSNEMAVAPTLLRSRWFRVSDREGADN
jgi:sialate O-acetylesterase